MDNGIDYMEYVLLYVDDCLVVSQHPDETLGRQGKYFPLKAGLFGPPKLYSGGKLSKLELHGQSVQASIYTKL